MQFFRMAVSLRRAAPAVVTAFLVSSPAWAASHDGPVAVVSAVNISDMEDRALHANPKDQALMYADLADKMVLLASQQVQNGEEDAARATLARLEACTAHLESNLAQSKSLKKTELMLHTTNRHLSDLVRAASYDVKPMVQDTLRHLNNVQTSMLTMIFAK